MSSGGSLCSILQVGQANSANPGATDKIIRHPAQRTWRLPEAEEGGVVTAGANGEGTDGWVIFSVQLCDQSESVWQEGKLGGRTLDVEGGGEEETLELERQTSSGNGLFGGLRVSLTYSAFCLDVCKLVLRIWASHSLVY